jgi:hypothetical protein
MRLIAKQTNAIFQCMVESNHDVMDNLDKLYPGLIGVPLLWAPPTADNPKVRVWPTPLRDIVMVDIDAKG